MRAERRRDWSFVTGEQLEGYFKDAQKLIEFAAARQLHPFAAAVAGVAFIRNALKVMGGEMDWWLAFVRTGNLPGLEFPRYRADPSQNPPRE